MTGSPRDGAEEVLRAHVRRPGPVRWCRRLGVVPWPARDTGPRCSCGIAWPCPIARTAEWETSGRDALARLLVWEARHE